MFSADNLLNNFEIERERRKKGRWGEGRRRRRGGGGRRNSPLSIFAFFFLFPSFSSSCDSMYRVL